MKLYVLLWVMASCCCDMASGNSKIAKFCAANPESIACGGKITHCETSHFTSSSLINGRVLSEDPEEDPQLVPEDAKVFEVIRNLLKEREEAAKDLNKKDQTEKDTHSGSE
ncbi:uncharacterized protein [Apostichopus japonicus]|uniref:uncharacterized protein isoform X2 n=1 Tax=Stichopus japonicus TaxID=307972 RepID=UPI003AB56593